MSFNKSKEAFLEVETYWTEGFNEKEEICQIFTPLSRNHPIFQNVISLLKHNAIKDTLIQIAMVTILSILSVLCVTHVMCMYLETGIAVIQII